MKKLVRKDIMEFESALFEIRPNYVIFKVKKGWLMQL